jgi:large subunit ribosomal protein L25
MAAIKQLAAAARTGTGKGAARSVRRESRVPAVIYGGGEAPQPISLDYKTINQLIYAGRFLTTIFEIDVDGKVERVVPRDYQLDVVRDTPLHVDFLRLRSGTKLRVSVPVHMSGADVSPGIKLGGTLNVVRHQIDLRVPAENIPDSIAVDISQMGIGDSLHVSAVTLPEGCTPIITDRDFTIATIAPPVKVEEAPAAAPAAPAKGKK